MIRFLTFEQFHNKRGVGSTNIRVHSLIKYWPEAGIYKYGECPDVMIFQKVYMTQDYKFHRHFEGIKILDICDPDWMDGMAIKETVDNVDGVSCPTEALAEYIRQMTDKPVKVIPDRHDLVDLPQLKTHKGELKRVVWFGYKQNATLLRFAVPTLERMGLELTVISNEDPMAWRWGDDPDSYEPKYKFKKYDGSTIKSELARYDVCLLPPGNRPEDRFKSDNKTTLAWLCGLPVAQTGDDLRRLMDPCARQEEVDDKYRYAIDNYDCKISVREMQEFIEELKK
jgi:hypothetical protein